MSPGARIFHLHAEAVLDHELRRARGRLAALPRDRRLAVEHVSARVAAALVDAVLEEAAGEPALARALASIYGPDPAPELTELTAVSCGSD